MRRKKYSRLSKRVDSQSKKTFVFSILGIIIIMFIMVKFGIPLLANFTGFISGFNKNDINTVDQGSSFIVPPILDPIVEATNSSKLKVSGQASSGQDIAIYLNNAMFERKTVKGDGSFSFTIYLRQGDNKIKAQTIEGNKKSEFSEEENIKFLNKAPTLEIDFPSDGQSFDQDQNQIEVSGSTDEEAKVTVNNFWVTTKGNRFSYKITLEDGENNIIIAAEDEAGNKTEKKIKVTYSP